MGKWTQVVSRDGREGSELVLRSLTPDTWQVVTIGAPIGQAVRIMSTDEAMRRLATKRFNGRPIAADRKTAGTADLIVSRFYGG